MQRHHTGSGRRRVIPADWSEHHRLVVTATHTATVQLRRPGGAKGPFDPDLGYRPVTPYAPYYTGPARIQVLGGNERDAVAADQEVSTIRYAVMADHAVAGNQLGDLCTITAVDDNGDADLVDRTLTVEAITRGSLHWERRLLCTDDLETPETEEAP